MHLFYHLEAMTVKKLFATLVALGCLATAAFAAGPKDIKDIKAGFVYIGPVNDGGYTHMHEVGRQEMHQAFPDLPESVIVESVPEGPDSLRVIEQLIRRNGCNLIIANSFGYMDYMAEAAAKYPDVTFMHCSGYKSADNMANYFGRMYQARYLTGIVAGSVAKGNKLGFVASFPIPEVIRAINAFTLGAQSVNPNIEVNVVWVYSWFDPGKEKEAAKALIDSGCEVIAMHADSGATPQACEESDVWVVGYDSDMSTFAPTKQLTSAMWDWGQVYIDTVKRLKEGTWNNEPIWWGLKEKMVFLAPLNDAVPQEARQLIAQKESEMVEGKWDVFTGPIFDQAGNQKVAEGQSMSDADMLAMNWFVKGVNGSLSESN